MRTVLRFFTCDRISLFDVAWCAALLGLLVETGQPWLVLLILPFSLVSVLLERASR